LQVKPVDAQFQFVRPAGVSGVDASVLPADPWNVRNFGWFPRRNTVPTITMRTANEAAESADFINRNYLTPTAATAPKPQ
jgi:hypothetical protein